MYIYTFIPKYVYFYSVVIFLDQWFYVINPMDRGAWWAAVHGVAKESDRTERLHFHFSLSCIGGGNGNPLQCSCLENPRDGGAWWAAVYGVAQSRTRLSDLAAAASTSTQVCINSPPATLFRSLLQCTA